MFRTLLLFAITKANKTADTDVGRKLKALLPIENSFETPRQLALVRKFREQPEQLTKQFICFASFKWKQQLNTDFSSLWNFVWHRLGQQGQSGGYIYTSSNYGSSWTLTSAPYGTWYGIASDSTEG